MRPIRMRAWDTETNSWVEATTYMLHTSGNLIRVSPNIILTLSTLVKDKNGQEVYDGDIVRMFEWEELMIVTWYEHGFYVIPIDSEDMSPSLIPTDHKNRAKNLEIVTNIYERPELRPQWLDLVESMNTA